ncbi:hypothetical protein, partial [Klebsiella pneumoniae]|uniref:hypothetical protein n=1 Tax=Klebsiella pneumoniae TaxID=573 RepID=UPI00405574AA
GRGSRHRPPRSTEDDRVRTAARTDPVNKQKTSSTYRNQCLTYLTKELFELKILCSNESKKISAKIGEMHEPIGKPSDCK